MHATLGWCIGVQLAPNAAAAVRLLLASLCVRFVSRNFLCACMCETLLELSTHESALESTMKKGN